MGRNLDPKCKQCRRVGEKLMLKGDRCSTQKCAMVKRNYPPGCHGQKNKRKQSDYGIQLTEKQKAKKQYNLNEKQFSITFEKAKKHSGNTGDNLFKLLELRLDNAVYRLNMANSRNQARQLVNHGHFTVNGKAVNIPSYSVKVGDIVKVKERSKKFKHFKDLGEKLKKATLPSWVNVNTEELSGKILHLPTMDDIRSNLNIQMIVEFYSR
ncbi:MAG: 30S ribosomal protein S4 [Patescibacteria group bacterium]|nr:30S ribosomal protein S4 [Patescibacteria group bacterium]MDD4610537.1 30S ribosomal protein S4 [Patescibacteria group bacterium]